MRYFLIGLFLLSCDDHKFTGGHSSSETVTREGYSRVQSIMENSCGTCHGEGATAPVLVGDLCASLVGVPSTQSALNYVESGSSSDSYLIHKLNNTQSDVGGAGGQMPIGTPLSADDINIITSWIDDGALCEGSTTTPETTSRTGQEIHDSMCMGCHAGNGIELSDEVPSLGDSELEDVIINGTGSMPPQTMTVEELAILMTYLREEYGEETNVSEDADEDGYDASVDCDDDNASTYPGAPEICDNQDNDCDDETDEEPTDGSLWYLDTDGDEYGDPATEITACEQDGDYVAQSGDCDDTHNETFPGAAENEGSDCMRDDDKDGYGDQTPSNGAVTAGSDCNDDDDTIHPGADEDTYDQTDSNCNGSDNY